MKVHNRLFLLASLSVASVFIVASVLLVAWLSVDSTLERGRYFERIQTVVYGLERTLNDYEDTREERFAAHWGELKQQLGKLLAAPPELSAAQIILINSIDNYNKGLSALFARLSALYEGGKIAGDSLSIEQHLKDMLLAQMETIREDSRHLMELARDEIQAILSRQLLIVVGTLGLLVLLMGNFSMRIAGSISGSLNELQDSFRNLAKGRFEPVSISTRGDEFSDIACQYNQTLDRLNELTISRDALQNLVDQRTNEIRTLADSDPLTGVANRRVLFERGQREFAAAKRHNYDFAVLMLDCDHFKLINDSHGHAVGDQALIHLCRMAEQHIREIDLLARYGGEEFVILLSHTGRQGAVELAERLRCAVEAESIDVSEIPLRLTISIGIACLEPSYESFDQILQQADRAVYIAKQRGRNCTELTT